jgi:hypothetical protein
MTNQTPNLEDLAVEGSTYLISLTKLTGQRIVDIHGYLTSEYGEAAFKLCDVVLENGSVVSVEGEHDLPYLSYVKGDPVNLDTETLNALYEQRE